MDGDSYEDESSSDEESTHLFGSGSNEHRVDKDDSMNEDEHEKNVDSENNRIDERKVKETTLESEDSDEEVRIKSRS